MTSYSNDPDGGHRNNTHFFSTRKLGQATDRTDDEKTEEQVLFVMKTDFGAYMPDSSNGTKKG